MFPLDCLSGRGDWLAPGQAGLAAGVGARDQKLADSFTVWAQTIIPRPCRHPAQNPTRSIKKKKAGSAARARSLADTRVHKGSLYLYHKNLFWHLNIITSDSRLVTTLDVEIWDKEILPNGRVISTAEEYYLCKFIVASLLTIRQWFWTMVLLVLSGHPLPVSSCHCLLCVLWLLSITWHPALGGWSLLSLLSSLTNLDLISDK